MVRLCSGEAVYKLGCVLARLCSDEAVLVRL